MSERHAIRTRWLSHAVLALAITLVFTGLVVTLVSLPPTAPGLSAEVDDALARAAVQNPVNATLLDFRSYDTLLEIAVLLLTVIAIRTSSRGELAVMQPDNKILLFLSGALLPVMILVAGYLLVAGLDSAGGAFQAGAILAAAGVLRILSGSTLPLSEYGTPLRWGLLIGLAAFVAVGVSGMALGNAFLDYPPHGARVIVLLLEAGVTVSVALALLELFVGVLRVREPGETSRKMNAEER